MIKDHTTTTKGATGLAGSGGGGSFHRYFVYQDQFTKLAILNRPVHISKSVTVTQSLMGLPRPRGPGYRSKTYPCASGLANDARGSQFKLVDAWTRTDMVRILRLIHNPARGTKLQVAFSRGDRDREGKRPGGLGGECACFATRVSGTWLSGDFGEKRCIIMAREQSHPRVPGACVPGFPLILPHPHLGRLPNG